jgi:hypothetical protein
VNLGRSPVTLRECLVDGRAPELPEGYSLNVELDAIDMLRRLLPAGATEVGVPRGQAARGSDRRPGSCSA